MDVPRPDSPVEAQGDVRGGDAPGRRGEPEAASRNNWALLLLIIPYITLLYPPLYNSLTPKLGAVPYFIWYQFLWVLIGAGITAVVYKLRG